MSQESGAAKPEPAENPAPTTSIGAEAALADEAKNSNDHRVNLHDRTNTEQQKQALRPDNISAESHNTEAAVNAALDSAIDDIASQLNTESSTEQGASKRPHDNRDEPTPTQTSDTIRSSKSNEKSQSATKAEASNSPSEQSKKPSFNGVTDETNENETAQKGDSGKSNGQDSRHQERQSLLQPAAEQSGHLAQMLTEAQKQDDTSGKKNSESQSGNQTNADASAEKQSATSETMPTENQLAEQESQENKKRKSSKGKNKKAQQNAPLNDIDQNENETGASAEDSNEIENAKTKKKNRRKSKQNRSSVDGAKPATEDDPETAEIKQRIKQFGNEIRSAAAVGKPQTETTDDSSNSGPITRRLSADAMEFVPTGTATQGTPAESTETTDSISKSALPPTAIDAPEFVPTKSQPPPLTRPKSVKDIINQFDNSNENDDVSGSEHDNSAAEPNAATNMSDRDASKPNAQSDHDKNTANTTKEVQKLESGPVQESGKDPIQKRSKGLDSQEAKKPVLHERIKQFNTAAHGSSSQDTEQTGNDQASKSNPPDNIGADKALKQEQSQEKQSGTTVNPTASQESTSKKSAVQDRIKQFSTASHMSMLKLSDKSNEQPESATGSASKTLHNKASSLGDVNLDIGEEVLEAPSPSIALVKKPITDLRARQGPAQRTTGSDSKSAETPATSSRADSGGVKPGSAENKGNDEKAISRTGSEQSKPKPPFSSADSNGSGKSAAEQNADQSMKSNLEKVQENVPEKMQKQSGMNNDQSKETAPERSKKQEKKEAEPKQPDESKPEPAVEPTQAMSQINSSKQHDQKPAEKSSSKSCCVIV